METIAIYWESKIRIYGTTLKKGLTLIEVATSCDKGPQMSERLESFCGQTDKFLHLSSLMDMDENWYLYLVMDPAQAELLSGELESCRDTIPLIHLKTISDVELLALHGPHFQDRYGIAEAAYSLLQKDGYQILSSSCTGTSISLVVPKYSGEAVVTCLSENFIVPKQ